MSFNLNFARKLLFIMEIIVLVGIFIANPNQFLILIWVAGLIWFILEYLFSNRIIKIQKTYEKLNKRSEAAITALRETDPDFDRRYAKWEYEKYGQYNDKNSDD